jgi:hypothetical protein
VHRRVAELVVLELLLAFLRRSGHVFSLVQERTAKCVLNQGVEAKTHSSDGREGLSSNEQ